MPPRERTIYAPTGDGGIQLAAGADRWHLHEDYVHLAPQAQGPLVRFEAELNDAVLAELAKCAPHEMRRALMTAFGNAKLGGRYTLEVRDLPEHAHRRQAIGFVQSP